jgi:hypothetical protein
LGRRLKGLVNLLAGSVGSKNAHATKWECLSKFPRLITQFIQVITNLKAKLSQALGFLIAEIVLVTPGHHWICHTDIAVRSAWLRLAYSHRAG